MLLDAALRTRLDSFSFSSGGLLRVTTRPWSHVLASGGFGVTKYPLYLWGFNLNPTVQEPIWPPSAAYSWPTADQQPRVVSTSVNDDGAPLGTGAQVIRVWYLDTFNNPAVEDVTMNGVGVVVMAAANVRRVNRVEVLACGVIGNNDGDITVYQTDGVTPMAFIMGRMGRNAGIIQTVPAGHRDTITGWHVSFGAGTTGVLCQLLARTDPAAAWDEVDVQSILGQWDRPLAVPRVLAAGTDYYGECVNATGYDAYVFLTGYREDLNT